MRWDRRGVGPTLHVLLRCASRRASGGEGETKPGQRGTVAPARPECETLPISTAASRAEAQRPRRPRRPGRPCMPSPSSRHVQILGPDAQMRAHRHRPTERGSGQKQHLRRKRDQRWSRGPSNRRSERERYRGRASAAAIRQRRPSRTRASHLDYLRDPNVACVATPCPPSARTILGVVRVFTTNGRPRQCPNYLRPTSRKMQAVDGGAIQPTRPKLVTPENILRFWVGMPGLPES